MCFQPFIVVNQDQLECVVDLIEICPLEFKKKILVSVFAFVESGSVTHNIPMLFYLWLSHPLLSSFSSLP